MEKCTEQKRMNDHFFFCYFLIIYLFLLCLWVRVCISFIYMFKKSNVFLENMLHRPSVEFVVFFFYIFHSSFVCFFFMVGFFYYSLQTIISSTSFSSSLSLHTRIESDEVYKKFPPSIDEFYKSLISCNLQRVIDFINYILVINNLLFVYSYRYS